MTSSSPRNDFNVHDIYKTLTVEEINHALNPTRSKLINVFVNSGNDFNLSSGIRNANWFNIQEVIILGKRKWDRRGAVGAHNYIPLTYTPTIEECITYLKTQNYTLVAAEITATATPLPSYEWNPTTAIFYGEEQAGLSPELLEHMDDVVYIPGRGSVRSINVSTTSGIFTYDYSMKQGLL